MKKTKVYTKKLVTCANCPYCKFNPDCDPSGADGYDCYHEIHSPTSKRIIDYWKINLNSANFWTPSIPDWCPLPDGE